MTRLCVTWLVYVWHDSFVCWLALMWHDTFIYGMNSFIHTHTHNVCVYKNMYTISSKEVTYIHAPIFFTFVHTICAYTQICIHKSRVICIHLHNSLMHTNTQWVCIHRCVYTYLESGPHIYKQKHNCLIHTYTQFVCIYRCVYTYHKRESYTYTYKFLWCMQTHNLCVYTDMYTHIQKEGHIHTYINTIVWYIHTHNLYVYTHMYTHIQKEDSCTNIRVYIQMVYMYVFFLIVYVCMWLSFWIWVGFG